MQAIHNRCKRESRSQTTPPDLTKSTPLSGFSHPLLGRSSKCNKQIIYDPYNRYRWVQSSDSCLVCSTYRAHDDDIERGYSHRWLSRSHWNNRLAVGEQMKSAYLPWLRVTEMCSELWWMPRDNPECTTTNILIIRDALEQVTAHGTCYGEKDKQYACTRLSYHRYRHFHIYICSHKFVRLHVSILNIYEAQ